jgi:LacI family transcriptional regulator
MKKVTIAKIAELSGVSKATVSRVLNGYPHIRPEVREKVQNIIAETGFQPSHVARLMTSDRSNIIGLIIPSGPQIVFSDPYFPALTHGITQAANRNNQTLALFIFHSEEEGRHTVNNILAADLLDGVIVTADRKESSFVPSLIEREMPFVLIGRPENENDRQISFIDTDNIAGSYTATKHLIDLGHRRIATVASAQNSAGDDRYRGYQKALTEHGLLLDPKLVSTGDYSVESGYYATQKLLPEHPDAIFVASDAMALGVLRALREVGLKVPDDVAIVSYDDLPPALQADPPLTTVRQQVEKIGSLAVDTLMEFIADPSLPPREVILPTQLIVRASCGGSIETTSDSALKGAERSTSH